VPFDRELEERIARHRESRGDESWSTIEEPLHLARAIRETADQATILVDCLTMWVGNLMWTAEEGAADGGKAERGSAPGGSVPPAAPTESDVASACEQILAACRQRDGVIVFVTNEVGLGIIPENPAARLYRDLLGRCNQVMAAAAGTVVLMVSGLPVVLKSADGLRLPDPSLPRSPSPESSAFSDSPRLPES
jgi:adenosylcobinamide kinase/adenosylcobinamide-phosphate guanylyltransferase